MPQIPRNRLLRLNRLWPRRDPQTENTPMSDDKQKTGGQDRDRINVNQDYELRNWAKSMNTTPERVKEAVQAVGDRADKVRDYLESKPTTFR
jgi:hypothetical protein